MSIFFYYILKVLDRCKEYDAVIGYNYRTYFKLNELNHVTPKDDELINLNIIILGSKDAHILLSPNDEGNADTPVYEIGRFFFDYLKTHFKKFTK